MFKQIDYYKKINATSKNDVNVKVNMFITEN